MSTITKAAKFIAFSFAVLLTNCSLALYAPAELIEITGFQPATESHGAIAQEDQTVNPPQQQTANPPQQEWVLDSNSIEVHSHIETFDAPHSKFMVEFDSIPPSTIFHESIQPDFTSQFFLDSDSPNTIFLKDVGYDGPGDMRTHLWKDHSSDLQGNGISHETLMSMPLESVQKWHNYFHGTEAAPASP